LCWYHKSEIIPRIQVELKHTSTMNLWISQCRCPWRGHSLRKDCWQNLADIKGGYKLVTAQCKSTQLHLAKRWQGDTNLVSPWFFACFLFPSWLVYRYEVKSHSASH
jgi:hypothetical protein